MGTESTYNYGPLANYRVTWYDGTTQDVKAHSIDYPPRTRDDFGRNYNTAQHIRIFASLEGRWTMVLSAPEHQIRKIEFIDRDPEPEPEVADETEATTTFADVDSDESEAEAAVYDNGDGTAQVPVALLHDLSRIPWTETEKQIDKEALLATPIESLLDTGVRVVDVIENGVVTDRSTYPF